MNASLTETQVKEHILVWTLGGETIQTSYGTNCAAVVGPDAVLLVDPLIAPAYARQVEAALRAHTAAPVRCVILTHHHTDHTWGAAYFAAQGVVIIAHRVCRERMIEEHPAFLESRRQQPELRQLFADAALVLPSIIYDESLVVHLGELEVELWHPGHAHTPGDTFLFIPQEGVAICGDLLFSGYHFNYEHASIPGVREGLRALQAVDADTFIPGHGAVAGSEALEQQAAYHSAVEEIVRTGMAEGKDDAALADEIRSRFPDYRLGIVVPSSVVRMKEYLATKRA